METFKISTPSMKAIFMLSGCAGSVTLILTIGDYIDALSEYLPKIKEIYPPNFRLYGDIQKCHINGDRTIGIEGVFPLDEFEPYARDDGKTL